MSCNDDYPQVPMDIRFMLWNFVFSYHKTTSWYGFFPAVPSGLHRFRQYCNSDGFIDLSDVHSITKSVLNNNNSGHQIYVYTRTANNNIRPYKTLVAYNIRFVGWKYEKKKVTRGYRSPGTRSRRRRGSWK